MLFRDKKCIKLGSYLTDIDNLGLSVNTLQSEDLKKIDEAVKLSEIVDTAGDVLLYGYAIVTLFKSLKGVLDDDIMGEIILNYIKVSLGLNIVGLSTEAKSCINTYKHNSIAWYDLRDKIILEDLKSLDAHREVYKRTTLEEIVKSLGLDKDVDIKLSLYALVDLMDVVEFNLFIETILSKAVFKSVGHTYATYEVKNYIKYVIKRFKDKLDISNTEYKRTVDYIATLMNSR